MDLTDPDVKALVRRLETVERDLAAMHAQLERPLPDDLGASAVVRNATFEQAVDLLLDASPWVGDEHTPYVSALFTLARTLDNAGKISAATMMEFRQNVNDLRKCAPEEKAGDKPDQLDAVVARLLG
ncbi:hypothetical protein [Rhodococcus pyridinivorans]|nr:hypothetical protein [Rhodococcus pyridinivorans]MCD2142339.1 hypothetical protein [Rhodococcus pyridinivorans]